MTYLDLILIAKIVGTALFVGLPFLLLPSARLIGLLKIEGAEAAMPLIRLYGWAVIALLVGYCFGFSWITGGTFPFGVVTMGLVSNAGATVLLMITGAWRQALPVTVFLGVIAASLMISMWNQEWAMQAL
ncbi:MAG: hypothetical protein AAF697_12640 [Pseudomonadota bacterium]